MVAISCLIRRIKYKKKPVHKNQKITNLEAEIFCYTSPKQEPSAALVFDKVLNYFSIG